MENFDLDKDQERSEEISDSAEELNEENACSDISESTNDSDNDSESPDAAEDSLPLSDTDDTKYDPFTDDAAETVKDEPAPICYTEYPPVKEKRIELSAY